MEDSYKPIHPILRIASFCLGAFFLLSSLIVLAQTDLSFSLTVLRLVFFGLVVGPFFIYVGITGKNFYWKPEQGDE